MTRIFAVLILCSCFLASGFSQVNIDEDYPIGDMMQRYSEINNATEIIDGWRIQIMAKTDRLAIQQAKESFLREFPGINADWTHSKPYYRLRAGAFQTKLEAIQMLQQLKNKYPGAFPVKDNISKQELLTSY